MSCKDPAVRAIQASIQVEMIRMDLAFASIERQMIQRRNTRRFLHGLATPTPVNDDAPQKVRR